MRSLDAVIVSQAEFITVDGAGALEGHLLTPRACGSATNSSGVVLFFSVQFKDDATQAEGFWPVSLGTTKISLDAAAIKAAGGSVGAVVTTALGTPAEVRIGFSLVSTAVVRAEKKEQEKRKRTDTRCFVTNRIQGVL